MAFKTATLGLHAGCGCEILAPRPVLVTEP
jgi:hypothetical protein